MTKKPKPANQHTDAAESKVKRNARRRLIQTLALTGGIASSKLVPGKWVAPAVQTAVLPVHASGSECLLGNRDAQLLDVAQEPAGPGPVQDLANDLANVLVPQAQAGDEQGDTLVILTGCYWITFACNSNEGTLWVTTNDGDQSAPFTSGVEGDILGFCFIVTLQNDGSSATLLINDGICGASDQAEPIQLNDPTPNCVPCEVNTDDAELICGGGDRGP